MKTIFEQFEDTVARFPERGAVAALHADGMYRAVSYHDLHENVLRLVKSLAEDVRVGDRIAILAENSPEWLTVDLAAAYLGAIVVPIHAAYNFHYIEYVLKHAEPRILFISHELFLKHHKELRNVFPFKIIVIGGASDNNEEKSVSWNAYLSRNADDRAIAKSTVAMSDDMHTIIYTSGTTGDPKGVMLTHANLISNALASREAIPIAETDRFFSFLPLSHIFERTCGYYVPLFTGASIYFARSAKTVIEDIKKAQPTILVCVPRVFERVHEKIIERFTKSELLKKIFKHAMHLAHNQKNPQTLRGKVLYWIYDTIIFRRVRSVFGGRLRIAVSGGASLSKHIAEFFDRLGILILEGYGLTETSPVVTCNRPDVYRFGSVGKTVSGVEMRLSDSDEILVKGTGVMKGYYKADEKTSEAIDPQGWFHTGDLGHIDNEGFLTIIGRQKEMIILSTGRNVAPVPIEQALEESKYIKQAMVYSRDKKSLEALIVPSLDQLKVWCDEGNIKVGNSFENPRIQQLYLSEIEHTLNRFQSHEQIRSFKIVTQEFTVENGMLTPTQKLKRLKIFESSKVQG